MTIPLSLIPADGNEPKAAPVKVHLVCPSYDGRYNAEVVTALFSAFRSGFLQSFQLQSGSWLQRNFNAGYSMALNRRKDQGITHFCMLHEDVLPQTTTWLPLMLKIALEKSADILSVIAPLKNEQGLTSTALDIDGRMVRRLTLHEAYTEYEPTFTRPDLLINTGLMLVDLRNDWAQTLHFEMKDGIDQDAEGRFVEWGIPEDWDFSREARKKGARIFATREIPIIHRGGGNWPNTSGWGTLKRDIADISLAEQLLKNP